MFIATTSRSRASRRRRRSPARPTRSRAGSGCRGSWMRRPDMSDLTRLSAADLAAKIKGKEVSAVEVAQAHLDRIEAVDSRVHAFLHVDREGALAAAARVDKGEVTGPLAGVPVAVKDVIATKGVPTTAGSKILEGWRPPYNATLVERPQAAGTVMLGK